jgi:peptidoglycan/LPS O-acetylase OafA/YrhL
LPLKEIAFDTVFQALGAKFSVDNAFAMQGLVLVGTLAVTVPLAYLSYRYIELPFVRLGRRLSQSRTPEPQKSVALARH